MSHNPAESSTTTKFPINWEIEDVVAQVEDLLASRGLAGRFSPIEEEAEDYEEMGPRDDGLEGHYVSLARMNHALLSHGWALVEVVGDEHEVCAVPLDEVETLREVLAAEGRETSLIPSVRWSPETTFTR